jgi:hypothetical protein
MHPGSRTEAAGQAGAGHGICHLGLGWQPSRSTLSRWLVSWAPRVWPKRAEAHPAQVLAGEALNSSDRLILCCWRPSFDPDRMPPFAFPPPRPEEVAGNSH